LARVEPVAPTTANGTLDPKLMPTNVRNRTSKSDFNDALEGKVGGGGAARSLASSHGFDLQLPLRIQQPATYYG
jgi:hypothetical protein